MRVRVISFARQQTPELVCARALACYRAGRPDLTERILAEDLPPSEITGEELAPFPGPHEQWMIANAPAKQPAIGALTNGRAGVTALAHAAPDDAEPDQPSLELDEHGGVVPRLAYGNAGHDFPLTGLLP